MIDLPKLRSLKTLATGFSVEYRDKRLIEGRDRILEEFCSKGEPRKEGMVVGGRCLVKTLNMRICIFGC